MNSNWCYAMGLHGSAVPMKGEFTVNSDPKRVGDDPSGLERPEIGKSLPRRIIDHIEYLIEAGRLRPGDQLPSEIQLAQSLDVGRSSVREAIRVLDELGVVMVHQGKRTVLRKSGQNILDMPVKLVVMMDGIPYKEVSETRKALEARCVKLAALRATHADIKRILDNVDECEKCLKDREHFVELSVEFHLIVASAAHNRVLLRMIHAIRSRLGKTSRIEEKMRRSLEQHRDIAKCIALRNPQAAETAMMRHLETVERIRAGE